MRISLTIMFVFVSGLAGCFFDPNLGDAPFFCASSGKKCPDGYECDVTRHPNGLCVSKEEADTKKADAFLGDGGMKDADPPSKTGPIFLDGSTVLPSTGCLDDDSAEPNNTMSTATTVPAVGTIPDWEICYPGDVDHFAVKGLKKGDRLTVRAIFNHGRGDLELALLDPDGYVIRDSRGETGTEEVKLTVTDKEGTYTFAVYGFGTAINIYDIFVDVQ